MTPARIALTAALAVAVLATAVGLVARADAASGSNRAGLVVAFPTHTETIWVDFAEPEISGRQLLERSGLDVTFSSFGGLGEAVCKIEDTGCANPNDCWCQCQSGSCAYWGYFSLNNGEWAYQPLGLSKRTLGDGDIDGWAWGAGLPPPDFPAPKPCPTPSVPPPSAPPSSPAAPAANPASGGAQPDPPTPAPGGGGAGSAAGPAVVEATPTPAPASGGDATAVPAPEASSGAVRSVDSAIGGDGGRRATAAASREPDPDDGAPSGLIAFGAVATAMAAAVGAVVIRRRLRG